MNVSTNCPTVDYKYLDTCSLRVCCIYAAAFLYTLRGGFIMPKYTNNKLELIKGKSSKC